MKLLAPRLNRLSRLLAPALLMPMLAFGCDQLPADEGQFGEEDPRGELPAENSDYDPVEVVEGAAVKAAKEKPGATDKSERPAVMLTEEQAAVVDAIDKKKKKGNGTLTPSKTIAKVPAYDSDLAWKGNNKRKNVKFKPLVKTLQPGSATLFEWAEGQTFGNERWYARYSISLNGFVMRTETTSNTFMSGSAEAFSKLGGDEQSLVSLNGTAIASNDPADEFVGVRTELRLLGEVVASPTRGDKDAFRSEGEEKILDLNQPIGDELKQRFSIFGVPFIAKAQASANEFIVISGTIDVPNGVDAVLRPGARLYVDGSAGIGVDWASAGLRGQVTLVEVSLPISAKLAWGVGPSADQMCHAEIKGAVKGDFRLSSLAGHMDGYAEIRRDPPFFDKVCKGVSARIGSWTGVHKDVAIFNNNIDYMLEFPCKTQPDYTVLDPSKGGGFGAPGCSKPGCGV